MATPRRANGRARGRRLRIATSNLPAKSRKPGPESSSVTAFDNARLVRESQEKIRRLRKLQEISALLNSTLNQTEIRKRAIEAATVVMDAEAGSLLLLDEAAGELYFEVASGEKGEGVREIRLKVGQGIAGHVAKTGEPEIVNDVQHHPRFDRRADLRSGFVTRNMVCVPVKAKDKLLGVLQAINKKDGGLFVEEDLQDFVSLAHQVGIAIENANLYEEINRLFEGFISASVTAIESRDPTTSGHSGRVAILTCGLAEVDEALARQVAETDGILEFLLACNKPTFLRTEGFERLHQVARLSYDSFDGPRPYLNSQETLSLSIPKGSLTEEERLEIESHVTHTYRFLSTIPWTKSLQNVPLIAYGHHEKLDGSGYPRRIPGETISVQTRMMTISDIYDALTASDRPYKAAVPTVKALAILEDEVQQGKVDADLLQIFIDSKVYLRVHPA